MSWKRHRQLPFRSCVRVELLRCALLRVPEAAVRLLQHRIDLGRHLMRSFRLFLRAGSDPS